ncbi:MAG: universal stress protein [Halioglobus sp.]
MGKLLVIADIKGDGVATPRGLELASKLGLDAEVYAFVYTPLSRLKMNAGEKAALKKRLLAEREAVVNARIDKFSRNGQKVKLKVVWEKDVAEWVNNRCAQSSYQLVVKTGRRTESFAHASTDWHLIRECPAPVVIVAEKKWRKTQTVMAALDLGSRLPAKKKLNADILRHATELAQVMNTDLEVISAIEVPTLLDDLDLIDTRTYVSEAKEQMSSHVRALSKEFSIPEKDFVVKRGPVEKVIASQAAAKKAQIVVMGTVGRKGVKAKLIGNTAEKVLAHLKTDVLALKP